MIGGGRPTRRPARSRLLEVVAVGTPVAMLVVGLALAASASPARPSVAHEQTDPSSLPAAPDARLGGAASRAAAWASRTGGDRPGAALAVPAPLVPPGLDIRSGPVAVPLELSLPSVGSVAEVLGVGMTPTDVMDAPMGGDDDPVWHQAYWYRGSAVPGVASTAVIGGHVNDPLGRPGTFAGLDRVRPGDPVVVRDTRTGLDVTFTVTATTSFPLADTTDPEILRRIYGSGPVAGTDPQPSSDGLAHLTLITCAGVFRDGTHDERLVVEATRTS